MRAEMGFDSGKGDAMKEKPILFSTPMVKAILEGRKTMTRRVLKPQPSSGVRNSPFVPSGIEDAHGREVRPRYIVGDILWVRETLQLCEVNDSPQQFDWCYLANLEPIPEHFVNTTALPFAEPFKKHPAIFMPKWAARIWLEVTGGTIERVQDITPAECLLEGVLHDNDNFDVGGDWHNGKSVFAELWNSINGPGAWERNDWVAAYSFKVLSVNGRPWSRGSTP